MKLTSDSVTSKLLPASHRYHCGILPVNLFESTQDCFENQQEILVRDGLFTLMQFFLKNPVPQVKTKLLIQERLLPFIPVEWQDQVDSYAYVVKPRKMKASSLVIKCILNDALQFEKLIHQHVFHHDYEHVYFMPSTRTSLFSNAVSDQQSLLEKALVKVWDEMKAVFPQVKIATTSEIRQEVDFSDVEFFDLNDRGLLYTDDSTDLYLLSKGSTPVHMTPLKYTEGRFHNISPYHGVIIRRNDVASHFSLIRSEMLKHRIDMGHSDGYELLGRYLPHQNKWNSHDLPSF